MDERTVVLAPILKFRAPKVSRSMMTLAPTKNPISPISGSWKYATSSALYDEQHSSRIPYRNTQSWERRPYHVQNLLDRLRRIEREFKLDIMLKLQNSGIDVGGVELCTGTADVNVQPDTEVCL